MSENKLGNFLREVSNWQWDEFVIAESDKAYTSNQAMIFALIRSCTMQKMDAIKMSLNRLDGKLKTPIKIETPKIFYLFPNATLPEAEVVEHEKLPEGEKVSHEKAVPITGEVLPPEAEPTMDDNDLPSLSLRQTLTKMADYPRELPEAIIAQAEVVHQAVQGKTPMPKEIPRVKSVVAAHLLILAQARNIDALGEVFDQIDGKLAETIQILGDDLYITSYVANAPPGAYLNEDGVIEIEATVAQNMWAEKLGAKNVAAH